LFKLPKNANFIDAVYKKLQQKFPDTRGDTLYQMAGKIHDMLISYNVSEHDSAKMSAFMAENFARYWRNSNLDQINGSFSLSQIGIGTAFLR
jgi:hypothetical protein